MENRSRIDIEHTGEKSSKFEDLLTGDVFRVAGEDWLYMVVNMPPDAMVRRQGVSLKNGGRRIFNKDSLIVQVKMACTWQDMT